MNDSSDCGLEMLFTPAEFQALPNRDLRETVCVVFDVLRATSSMITALANGAQAVRPVAEISEALEARRRDPAVLLAGERNGLRIRADQTGGIDFDLGNSPREFTSERVHNRTIVMSTTNGTRALRACAKAQAVLIGALLNAQAVGRWVHANRPKRLLLVCGGTINQAALEDVLAAGAVAELVWPLYAEGAIADSAEIGRQLYDVWKSHLVRAASRARNGRRLLAIPELKDDVAFCLRRDVVDFSAALGVDGLVRIA